MEWTMNTLSAAVLLKYTNMNAQRSLDKEPLDAACWNWVLYGLRAIPVPQPSLLFGYVHRAPNPNHTRTDAATALNTNANHLYDNLQAHQPLRDELDSIRTVYDLEADNTTNRNHVRDAVFEIAIKAAGFTISNAVTPYRICMFEPQDTVMWDHWWLEINGAVVETVTGQKLYAYSSQYLAPAFCHPRNRVQNKTAAHGLSAEQQARVHARYVTSLQDTQVHWLEMLSG